jgi:regulator of protease activity HflC (stomatin/prohibitin superfamily)
MILEGNERLVVQNKITLKFNLIGPGRVMIWPWQKVTAERFKTGGRETVELETRTSNNNMVNIIVNVMYGVDLDKVKETMLPRVSMFATGGWGGAVNSHTKTLLRRHLIEYTRDQLSTEETQKELEEALKNELAGRVGGVGLNISGVAVVSVELEKNLQRIINKSEMSRVEAEAQAEKMAIEAKAQSEKIAIEIDSQSKKVAAEAERYKIEAEQRAKTIERYLELAKGDPQIFHEIIEWDRMHMLKDNIHVNHMVLSGQQNLPFTMPLLSDKKPIDAEQIH